jgi:hypothetical protein
MLKLRKICGKKIGENMMNSLREEEKVVELVIQNHYYFENGKHFSKNETRIGGKIPIVQY